MKALLAGFVSAIVLLSSSPVGAVDDAGFEVVFGDVHTHTRYSDGASGSPGDAFAAARVAGADFMATSDHNFMLTDEEWELSKQQGEAATTRDFSAIVASEYWLTNGYGEVIVFGVDELRNKANFRSPGAALSRHQVIPAFLDWLATEGGLGIWPHPGVYGDLDEFDHWTPARDVAMVGVEIHNYGSFLGAPANWGVHDYEDQFQLALSRGWHLMPYATSDTHAADWIAGSPVRTALLVTENSPDAVLDAMRSRRGYATLDQNLAISFSIGEVMMGGSIDPAADAPVTVEVEDPDGPTITRVELIGAGGAVIDAETPAVPSASVSWSPSIAGPTPWAYVRVWSLADITGGDGVVAWTAPIWFEPAG